MIIWYSRKNWKNVKLELLEERQTGIPPNRSTIDNTFNIGQIFEKCYERNIDLHNTFTDYTQALDSEHGKKIIEMFSEI